MSDLGDDDIRRRAPSGDDIGRSEPSDDELWRRDEIDSPCNRICAIHPDERICVGCLRSRDEIEAWSRLAPAERARIRAELPSRAPRLARRRGGRAARLKRQD